MEAFDMREQISDKLWELWRLWRQKSHPVRKGEITLEQYWLLKKLQRYGSQRISDLAQILGTKPSSATLSVQRLERDGLVQRARSVKDERVVRVSLTEKGLKIVNTWRDGQRKALSEILLPLNISEQQEFLSMLLKIIDSMQENDTHK